MSIGGVEVRSIPFGRPLIGDAEQLAVRNVLEGHMLTHGPRVKEFEAAFAEFTGAPHAIALASCTAGLHLAYFYLGLGEGDEVIVPAQTHVATAHAVEMCGAKPVFIDAEARTGNLDLGRLESLSVQLAGIFGTERPSPKGKTVIVAAGARVVGHDEADQGADRLPDLSDVQFRELSVADRDDGLGALLDSVAGRLIDRLVTHEVTAHFLAEVVEHVVAGIGIGALQCSEQPLDGVRLSARQDPVDLACGDLQCLRETFDAHACSEVGKVA